jgi:hypothetical protein
MCCRNVVLMGLSLLACSGSSAAPLVQANALQGQTLAGAEELPGFLPTDVLRTIGVEEPNLTVYGDFVSRLRTNTSSAEAAAVHYYFGSVGGGSPRALWREGPVAGEVQESLSIFANVRPSGELRYTANIFDPPAGPNIVPSFWVNDQLQFRRGDPLGAGPLGEKYFASSVSALFTTPAGISRGIISYADLPGGPAVGTALVEDLGAWAVLLASGDAVGDLGTVAQVSGAISSNLKWSLAGSNYLTNVTLTTGSGVTTAVVLNGAPLVSQTGMPLVTDALIPEADGGLVENGLPIEQFRPGSHFAVNESGDYALSVFTEFTTDPDNNVDQSLIYRNGRVWRREGEVIDGVPLAGLVEALGLNDRGDLAYIWNDHLFVNDRLIAGPGTPVDTTGDGVADSAVQDLFISKFAVANQPAEGDDGVPVVYFYGRVTGGLTALLRLQPRELPPGDYNYDGVVNAADYTVWRDTLGSTTRLAADGDRSAVVDQGDLAVWRSGFVAGGPTVAVAPEPSGVGLGWAAVVAPVFAVRARRRAARRTNAL